jgi:transposase
MKDERRRLERRRLRAARLLEEGFSQAEVARRVGVSPVSVFRWTTKIKKHGVDSLRSERWRGRPQELSKDQQAKIIKALKQGAEAHGWANGLWTLPRVAQLIKQLTGRTYHPGHVWKLLGSWGFSCQRPSKRAYQQDKQAVEHWKRVEWPHIKKKRKKKTEPSFSLTKAD